MKRRAKTSFIGPITQTRPNGHSFLYLQAGTNPIKLEYASKHSAQEARNQLLKGANTHPVANMKLLQAIQQALTEAISSHPQETPLRDELGDKEPTSDKLGDSPDTHPIDTL